MSETAIRVEGLCKRYRVMLPQERHNTLRDAVVDRMRRTSAAVGGVLRGRRNTRPTSKHFWALRDLSFEVSRGEVLGVIGANGAGKSTLLKILSQITTPTAGEVEIHGRVGSLLEVGTGFHTELTGRENVYLSGAILGMQRHEIERKFDEIVAFSEVGPFIDTPIKHYSSGMNLRLAFAVAAHLEPEILIIDEVLAVGDASFQKKCLGKMSAVAGEGRTVLFVSHNLDAVQRLCSRCVYLKDGKLVDDGEPLGVITRYLASTCDSSLPDTWIDLTTAERRGTGEAQFVRARFSSDDTSVGGFPHPLGPLEFELTIASDAARAVESLAVVVRSQNGTKLINADTLSQGITLHLKEGLNAVKLRIGEFCLNPGAYTVGLWLAASASGASPIDYVETAFDLEVVPDPSEAFGVTPGSNGMVASRFEVVQETPAAAVGTLHGSPHRHSGSVIG